VLFDSVPAGKKGEDIISFAQKKDIILRGDKPKYGSDGWFRVTVGSKAENRKFVRVIKEFFSK